MISKLKYALVGLVIVTIVILLLSTLAAGTADMYTDDTYTTSTSLDQNFKYTWFNVDGNTYYKKADIDDPSKGKVTGGFWGISWVIFSIAGMVVGANVAPSDELKKL